MALNVYWKYFSVVLLALCTSVVFAQNPASDFQYQLNRTNDGVIITKYVGRSTTVVVPGSIEGYPVEDIRQSTFQGNNNIVSVTIPDTILVIEANTFSGCRNLRTVLLPDSVELLNSSIFSGCENLTSVRLPNKLTKIPYDTFRKCSSLKSITFPPGIYIIESGAFAETGFQSITIPEGVRELVSTFNGCRSLTEVYLPASIRGIGDNTFRDCISLTNIHIPASVALMSFNGRNIFQGCKLSLATQSALRKLGYEGSF